jgi:hypothetical protein
MHNNKPSKLNFTKGVPTTPEGTPFKPVELDSSESQAVLKNINKNFHR